MSKGMQLWPGDRMHAFFRAHIRAQTSLDQTSVERLASALTKAVNRMLVWDAHVSETGAATSVSEAPAAETPLAPNERHARAENFNPYLFSAIVVLAKQGHDGLMKRLADIETAEHLRAFAEAQHVPVDPSLKKPDEIRNAILAAAERRLADRKAAAS